MGMLYRCPACGKKYLVVDLSETKCSENYVGTQIAERCPRCKVRLEKCEKERTLQELEDMSEEEWIRF